MIILLLVALGLAAVVLTRVRLSKEEGVAGLAKVSPLVLNVHTFAGLIGFVLFALYVLGSGFLGDSRDLVGILGLAFLWLAVVAGLAILARWMPTHGRHSQLAQDDDWAEGPGLSMIAHLGMLVGVSIMTVVYMLNKV